MSDDVPAPLEVQIGSYIGSNTGSNIGGEMNSAGGEKPEAKDRIEPGVRFGAGSTFELPPKGFVFLR